MAHMVLFTNDPCHEHPAIQPLFLAQCHAHSSATAMALLSTGILESLASASMVSRLGAPDHSLAGLHAPPRAGGNQLLTEDIESSDTEVGTLR